MLLIRPGTFFNPSGSANNFAVKAQPQAEQFDYFSLRFGRERKPRDPQQARLRVVTTYNSFINSKNFETTSDEEFDRACKSMKAALEAWIGEGKIWTEEGSQTRILRGVISQALRSLLSTFTQDEDKQELLNIFTPAIDATFNSTSYLPLEEVVDIPYSAKKTFQILGSLITGVTHGRVE